MDAVEERQEKMSHCVIKSISAKNATVLDTGRKFVSIKPENIYVLLCLILKMFFNSFMQIL